MSARLGEWARSFGIARGTILGFLILLCAAAGLLDLSLGQLGSQSLQRIGMNMVLALSLLPMIRGGTGLNFGMPLGLVAGLLGCVIALEFELTGLTGFMTAALLGVIFAVPIGIIYGLVLNAVRGNEMLVGWFLGLSFVGFFSLFWYRAPFSNPKLVFPIGGRGLRQTLPLRETFGDALDALFGTDSLRLGLLLAVAVVLVLVWILFRTKFGVEVESAGENPRFAESSGVVVPRARVLAVTASTCLAALGIVIFVQSFGLVQLYAAPIMFTLPTMAALLIGGASLHRANLAHVVIGVTLFQSILVVAPPVLVKAVAGGDELAESIRTSIQNGMILYALTRAAVFR